MMKYMKKAKALISSILVLILCFGMIGCQKKVKTIDGKYPLKYIFTDGYNGTSNTEGQYLSISNTADNISATLYLSLSDKYSRCSGYLTEYFKGSDYIEYKFWVNYADGTMFEFSSLPAVFYVYYFPDSDKCELRLKENFIYKFEKKK